MQTWKTFFLSILILFVTKQIKLHSIKVYQADSYVVKRRLKVASVLYYATKTNRI